MKHHSKGLCPKCTRELVYRQVKDSVNECYILFLFCLFCRGLVGDIITEDAFPFRDPAGEKYDMLSAIPAPVLLIGHNDVGC